MLLLLLGVSVLYAFVFLLAPFFFVRKEWRSLPGKGISAVYFAALGLGLHVLRDHDDPATGAVPRVPDLFADRHARVDPRVHRDRRAREQAVRGPALADAGAARRAVRASRSSTSSGSNSLTDSLLDQSLAIRVIVSLIVLAPLGFCLGMFMPLGLSLVAKLSEHADEYIAWSWAVNGFFSVIGSVLTTILSMSYGFNTVQYLALVVYGIAALAFTRIAAVARRTQVAVVEPVIEPVAEPTPA